MFGFGRFANINLLNYCGSIIYKAIPNKKMINQSVQQCFQ